MAIPKKKGLRKIKVAGISYFWRVSLSYYDLDNMRITIGRIKQPNDIILIDMIHVNKWLQFGKINPEEVKDEVKIVTSVFIKRAIEFVITNHLKKSKEKHLFLTYENNTFKVNERK